MSTSSFLIAPSIQAPAESATEVPRIICEPEDLKCRVKTEGERTQWKLSLALCESGDNPLALNKIDVNGTSSIGQWQFQANSWKYRIRKYKLFNYKSWEPADWENTIFSKIHQEIVLDRMIDDPTVTWQNEFPTCIKRVGLPPVAQG